MCVTLKAIIGSSGDKLVVEKKSEQSSELSFWLKPFAITLRYTRSDLSAKPLPKLMVAANCSITLSEIDIDAVFPCLFSIDEGELYGQTSIPISGLYVGSCPPEDVLVDITYSNSTDILLSRRFPLVQIS